MSARRRLLHRAATRLAGQRHRRYHGPVPPFVRAIVIPVVLAGLLATPHALRAQAPPPAPGLPLDLVALDAIGRPVRDLGPTDLLVEIDGQPRTVRSLRFVHRGAGAEEAARGGAGRAAAEPIRLVIVAVDETTLRRGRERDVASGVWRVVDALTMVDRVGLMLLPEPRGRTTLSADREPVRTALRGLTGRAGDEVLLDASQRDVPAGARPPAGEPGGEPGAPSPDPSGEPTVRQAPRDDRTARGDPADAEPAPDPFRTLATALAGLRDIPGEKFLVYVTGGARPRLREAEIADQAAGLEDLQRAASLARLTAHVVHVPAGGEARPPDRVARLAATTGGTVSVWRGKAGDLASLSAALSGGYVAEVEGLPEDQAGHVRPLRVTLHRKDVRVLAATRWSPRPDPLPALHEEPALDSRPDAAPGTPDAAAAVPRPAQAVPDAELDAVLARVGRYVDVCLAELGTLIAKETYIQRLQRTGYVNFTNDPRTRRTTKADLLLLRNSGGWLPFRDVYEVNGATLVEREDRLRKLFLENPATALEQGQRISEESARHNLGAVYRTINTPFVAFSFFQTASLPRFRFARDGTDTVDGVRAWRIKYVETGRPTHIVHGRTGGDLPAAGTVWVDPASGRVLRTLLTTRDEGVRVRVTVQFRANDAVGVWTPSKMEESYEQERGDTILAEATYSDFRRFQVTTDEMLGPPR